MPDRKYRIDLVINLQQVQAANRDAQDQARRTAQAHREIGDAVEAAGKKQEQVHVGLHRLIVDGLKLQEGLRRDAAAAQRQAIQDQTQGMVSLNALVADGLKFQEKARREAAAAAQQAIKDQTQGMVGLNSLVADGLKLQEKLRRENDSEARKAIKEQTEGMVGLNALIADGLKFQERLQRDAAAAERKNIQDQTQGMVGLNSLIADGLKLQEKLRRDAAAAAQKAIQDQTQGMIPLNALIQSGLDLQTRLARQQQQAAADQQRAMTQGMVGLHALQVDAINLRDRLDEASKAFKADMLQAAGAAMATTAGMLVAQFVKVRETVYNATQMVQDYREALLELAALKGQTGDTGKTLGENLALRAQTLQTRSQAVAFENAMRGAGEAAINENPNAPGITAKEFEKAVALTGAFQAVEGGNAEAHGTLAGIIPLISKKRMTAEDVAIEQRRLYNVFQPGNASFSSLIKQYSDISGYVTSDFYNKEDASALLAAFSLPMREKAGTGVEAFTRATVGGIGRMRGQGVEGSERQGKYLEGLGVTNQMSSMQIGNLIVGDLQRQQMLAQQQGQNFNPYDYLKHHGYGNQEDIMAVLQYKGFVESGVLQNKFLPLAYRTPTLAETTAPIQAAQATDPKFQQRKAEIAGEMANVNLGAGKEEFYYSLRRLAFENLKAQGAKGVSGDWQNFGTWGGMLTSFGAQAYGSLQVDAEMKRMMDAERLRVGLAPLPHAPAGGDAVGEMWKSGQELAGRGSNFGQKVLQDLLTVSQQQLNESQKTRQAFEAWQKQQAQPHAGPAPRPLRP